MRTKAKNRKSRVSDPSARARSLNIMRMASKNSSSSQSSQAGTFRRGSGTGGDTVRRGSGTAIERKNTGTDTISSVLSSLESLKLNENNQVVPSILECSSVTQDEGDQAKRTLMLDTPDPQSYDNEFCGGSHSMDYSEATQDRPNVTSDRAMRSTEDELDSISPVNIDGKRLHPFSLRANAIMASNSNEQSNKTNSPYTAQKSVRSSSLRRSLSRVVDAISIISNMAKVLPIIDDDEFNHIADQTFTAGVHSDSESRERRHIESRSFSPPTLINTTNYTQNNNGCDPNSFLVPEDFR